MKERVPLSLGRAKIPGPVPSVALEIHSWRGASLVPSMNE